jgi:hypothetical protein
VDSQLAVTLRRVAAFCFTCDVYGSLKSPVCSCVSITLPASSQNANHRIDRLRCATRLVSWSHLYLDEIVCAFALQLRTRSRIRRRHVANCSVVTSGQLPMSFENLGRQISEKNDKGDEIIQRSSKNSNVAVGR